MATATIFPSSDVTADWDNTTGATHWDEINELVSSPTDASFIDTSTDDDVDEFGMTDSPANTDEVSNIELHVRAQIDDASATAIIRCEFFHTAGTPVTGNPQDINGANLGGYGVLGNATKTWPTLTLTRVQADSLQLRTTFMNAP